MIQSAFITTDPFAAVRARTATDRTVGFVVLIALILATSGCASFSYYGQAVRGQMSLLAKRQPIDRVVADPSTPPELRDKLRLVLELREFAHQELHLPIDGLYLTYADLDRRVAVWNVHAARPFSLEPKTWRYPIVGRLQYRGFFSESGARAYARKLERRGYEVHLSGVEAYSTLGWFRDPVLSTFIHHQPAELAEILIHELAHQRLFIPHETEWNEAFAVAVAQEGVRRWLTSTGQTEEAERFARESARDREFVELLAQARDQLARLYEEAAPLRLDPARPEPALNRVQARKDRIIADLHLEFELFKTRWDGYGGYDRWFAKPINNAQLATVNSYFRMVPIFDQLLAAEQGDLQRFYRAVESFSELPPQRREQMLAQLLQDNTDASAPGASD